MTEENDEPVVKKQKLSEEDLEAERRPWENDQVWLARKTFLEAHWKDFPIENLRCLSQVFINVNMIGCEYSSTLMEKIRELGRGIMDRARRLENDRAFVKASVGRAHANDIREKIEAERRPTIEQRRAQKTPFEEKLVQLRAQLQIADRKSAPLQQLNTACGRNQITWQFLDKHDGAELRLGDYLICKRRISTVGVDKKEIIVGTVVETIVEGGEMTVVGKEIHFGNANETLKGPYECYEESYRRRLIRASRHLSEKPAGMAQLAEAMNASGLPMAHSLEQLRGWEQQLVVRSGDVLLAERHLKKGDCIANKTEQIVAEVAKQIINSISVPILITTPAGTLQLKLK
ncbi:unnamed protein product, partial [Mesorhabditis belari]|uniref:XRN2-binding (XTBD) domain-containing protein n=1 Tax=Mesorhabditis belari TaxID=2138241 RepID=A0AAF3J8F6_9BILA